MVINVGRESPGLRSYVSIDSNDFPLVPDSEVLGAPLNPFSPATQAGNSANIVSQRHAVRLWDDFRMGIGFKDDNEEHGGIAYGNMDLRVPGQLALPMGASPLGTTSGFSSATFPVKGQYMSNAANGSYCFFLWGNTPTGSVIRTIRGTNRNIVNTTTATEQVMGVAELGNAWYFITWDTVGFQSRLYQITSLNSVSGVITFSLYLTVAATKHIGLVNFDGKLVTYNSSTNVVQQLTSTPSWVTLYSGIDKSAFLEDVTQFFVWTDKTGSRDAVYILTSTRILMYDEEGQQWELFYDYSDLWPAVNAYAHVNKRDNTLIFVPFHLPKVSQSTGGRLNDVIFAFSPGTVDSWAVNKGWGLPTEIAFTANDGNIASCPVFMTSNSHWLVSFMYTPTVGSTTGIGSTVMARNDQGGWSVVFDAALANAGNAYSPIVGGAIGGDRMCVVTEDGRHWEVWFYDNEISHPKGSYEEDKTYFIQSGRVYNGQKNVIKLGSHFEVTYIEPPSAIHSVVMKWRTFDGTTLSGWSSSGNLAGTGQVSTAQMGNQTPYLYLEWRLEVQNFNPTGGGGALPIIESVALYFTYWQQNHFAYSFTIDLSLETWQRYYPDGTFHGKSRQYLQDQLLNIIDGRNYHDFGYNRFAMQEFIGRVDLLLSRREMADNGGGIYPCTARDLSP